MNDDYYSMRAALLLRRGPRADHPFGGASSVLDAILDTEARRQSSGVGVEPAPLTSLEESLRAPLEQGAPRRRLTSAIAALFY